MISIIYAAAGGFFGAAIRYIVSVRLNRSEFPYGTLLVNWAGSFLIGAAVSAEIAVHWKLFLTAGLAGALTTYSTLMKEIWLFYADNQKIRAISYTAWTFIIGILLAYAGYKL